MTVQSHEAQAIDAAQRLTDSLPAPPGETSAEASVSAQTPSMLPVTTEEVANAIQKDGISYIFEARSLTAVVRFVYTPIEGNFSDVEIEINNAEPIKVSEDGGVTIHMGGRNWAADDDGVERHFVSCEIVDDCVEARWQWKLDEELADFLYRIRLEGKSLLFEIEGGNGKATGIDLGYVSGAVHPRKLRVPYLNVGDDAPAILCTSGVFLSSYLDWFHTASSQLVGSHPGEDGRELRLNGGCTYLTASNGKRNNLQERWILTVSRQFEEVLPAIPQALPREGAEWLRGLVWYEIPRINSTEEAYVDCYERLRTLRQWGMSELLVLHPDDIWHDGDGRTALGMTAAEAKGGDDALQEYLEAVSDLGFTCALPCSYAHVSKLDAIWEKESAALNADGSSATAGPNRHLLKPTRALGVARDHLGAMLEKYGARVAYLGGHCGSPPWDRVDCDSRLEKPANWRATLEAEHELLAGLRQLAEPAEGIVIGEGGTHWLYAGLLDGFRARHPGPGPCRQPLLVDFALNSLRTSHVDAGVGSTDEFFAGEASIETHSRGIWLDRYIATTVAFGHAGFLPNADTWDLPSLVKTYYMLQNLQRHYLGVEVTSIAYHRNGSLLETSEALVSGAYEESQVLVTYANGLQVYVNGSWGRDWVVETSDGTYSLPPASFAAIGSDGPIAFSADKGAGRLDYAACDDYLYCDTRGSAMTIGAMSLSGAALLRHQDWQIDVFPVECDGEITVEPSQLWPNRRLPKLRILAFRSDDDDPQVLSANVSSERVVLEPSEDVYKFRITLPEWMVEPGQ